MSSSKKGKKEKEEVPDNFNDKENNKKIKNGLNHNKGIANITSTTIGSQNSKSGDGNPSSDGSNPGNNISSVNSVEHYDGFANGKEYYKLIREGEDAYLNKYSVKKDKKRSNEGQPLFRIKEGIKLPKDAISTIETLLGERIRPESLCENLINNSSYSYSDDSSKKSITIIPLDTTGNNFESGTYMPNVYKILVTDDTDLDKRIIKEDYILIGAYKKELVEKEGNSDGDIKRIAIMYLSNYNKHPENFDKKRKLVLFKRGRDVEIKDIDNNEKDIDNNKYGYLGDYLNTFINNYRTKKSQTSEPIIQPSETPASPQPSSNLESKIESGKETKDDNAIYSESYKSMYENLEKEYDKLNERYSDLEKKIEEDNKKIKELIELIKAYKDLTDEWQKASQNLSKEGPSNLEGKPQSSQSQTNQSPENPSSQPQIIQLPKKSISEYILNGLNKSNGLYEITYRPINNKSNNKEYDIVCKFDFKKGKKVVSTSADGKDSYDEEYKGFISTLETALSEYYTSERKDGLYQKTLGEVFKALKEDEGLKNQLKGINAKSVNIKIGKFEGSEDYYIKDLYIERDNSGFFGFFRKLFGKGYLKLDYDLGRTNFYFENVKRDIAKNYTNAGLEGYQKELFSSQPKFRQKTLDEIESASPLAQVVLNGENTAQWD